MCSNKNINSNLAPDLDMTHLERCIYLVSLRPKKQMLVDDSPISCVTLFVFGTVSVMPSLSETSQRPKLPERCKRKGSQDSQCNSFRIVNRWLLIVFCLCVYVIVCSVLRLILWYPEGSRCRLNFLEATPLKLLLHRIYRAGLPPWTGIPFHF